MPELPEVETIRRQLEPKLVGAMIVDAGSHWSEKFTPALEAVGSEITAARRRGKYLLFDLESFEGLERSEGGASTHQLGVPPMRHRMERRKRCRLRHTHD